MMQPRNLLLALVPPLCWGTGFTLTKPAVSHFQPLFLMFLVYAPLLP
jgi:drug/metabolite transporter (DMT)-like permease